MECQPRQPSFSCRMNYPSRQMSWLNRTGNAANASQLIMQREPQGNTVATWGEPEHVPYLSTSCMRPMSVYNYVDISVLYVVPYSSICAFKMAAAHKPLEYPPLKPSKGGLITRKEYKLPNLFSFYANCKDIGATTSCLPSRLKNCFSQRPGSQLHSSHRYSPTTKHEAFQQASIQCMLINHIAPSALHVSVAVATIIRNQSVKSNM